MFIVFRVKMLENTMIGMGSAECGRRSDRQTDAQTVETERRNIIHHAITYNTLYVYVVWKKNYFVVALQTRWTMHASVRFIWMLQLWMPTAL